MKLKDEFDSLMFCLGLPWADAVIYENGKRMYLDYRTDNLMKSRWLFRAYERQKLEWTAKKDCFGVYDIYCEKLVWNPSCIGFVDE